MQLKSRLINNEPVLGVLDDVPRSPGGHCASRTEQGKLESSEMLRAPCPS